MNNLEITDEMVTQINKFAKAIYNAHRHYLRGYNADDIISRFYRKLHNYNPDRGYTFESFIKMTMNCSVKDMKGIVVNEVKGRERYYNDPTVPGQENHGVMKGVEYNEDDFAVEVNNMPPANISPEFTNFDDPKDHTDDLPRVSTYKMTRQLDTYLRKGYKSKVRSIMIEELKKMGKTDEQISTMPIDNAIEMRTRRVTK